MVLVLAFFFFIVIPTFFPAEETSANNGMALNKIHAIHNIPNTGTSKCENEIIILFF